MTTTLARPTLIAALPREISLRFVAGMPGLEGYTRYNLIGIDDSPVYWLQCEDEPEIALPVADAFAVSPRYSFTLSTADTDLLGLGHPSDSLVLVVLTVSRGAGTITANLLAPIVVNRDTWAAKQVILDGTRHSLHHPVEMIDEGQMAA